jgi:CBS domain-containing protein
VICPVCQWENFLGEDVCGNCGADLWGVDAPNQAQSFQGRLLGMPLEELRAPAPQLVEADASAMETLRRMRQGSIDCLLVMDGDDLVGIFTDRDAILKLEGTDASGRTIRDVMTPDPVVLRRGDPVAVAINKMAVGGFRHVPIVDGSRPIGVVSARDVFRHLAAGLR